MNWLQRAAAADGPNRDDKFTANSVMEEQL
jgi:hypothetical protein